MKNNDYYHTDIDYLDLSDAASAHECTGLIPAGDAKSGDKDADKKCTENNYSKSVMEIKDDIYKSIYAFGTPLKCDRKNAKETTAEK